MSLCCLRLEFDIQWQWRSCSHSDEYINYIANIIVYNCLITARSQVWDLRSFCVEFTRPPASCRSPKTFNTFRLVGNSELSVGVSVTGCLSPLWWTGDLPTVSPQPHPETAGIQSSTPVTPECRRSGGGQLKVGIIISIIIMSSSSTICLCSVSPRKHQTTVIEWNSWLCYYFSLTDLDTGHSGGKKRLKWREKVHQGWISVTTGFTPWSIWHSTVWKETWTSWDVVTPVRPT